MSFIFETNESDIQFEKNDSDEPDIFNEKVVKEGLARLADGMTVRPLTK